MVNSKKVIATLGVVAGLGTSVLPLASYAEVHGATASPDTKTIRATVNEYFTLAVASSVDIDADKTTSVSLDAPGMNSQLTHTVTVTGNVYGGYDLKLGAKTSETALLFVKDNSKDVGAADRYNSNIKIPTVVAGEGGTTVESGTSAWGYKVDTSQTSASATPSYSGDWLPIKAAGNEDPIRSNANSSNGRFEDVTFVNYGISTSNSQAAGVYEGQVVYTATSKI